MDFLKDLALPQSLEHFHLVVLLAALSALVFIPYLSIALGTAVLSRRLSRDGREHGNAAALQLARTLAETAFASKSLIAFLGVIPGLSLVFSLAQILQRTASIAVTLAAFGFLFLFAGLSLLYAYRYTFRVQGLLEAYGALMRKHEGNIEGDIDSYRSSNLHAHVRFGTYGVFCLFIAVYLYVAALSVSIDPALWSGAGSIFSVLLTPIVWLRIGLFLAFAAAATGIGTLYIMFLWKRDELGEDEASAQLARRYGVLLSVAGLVVLPVFILLQLALLPGASLAGIVYGLAGLAVVLLFLAAHFLYAFIRNAIPASTAYALFFLLCGGATLVLSDYIALGYATRTHAESLAMVHTRATEELKASLGISAASATGEDIYNTRCSACHLFDKRKVGPPYQLTLPKYKDNKPGLMAFILNPVKIDPAYDPMPNQGLKPAEADSIASYLLAKVLGAPPVKP